MVCVLRVYVHDPIRNLAHVVSKDVQDCSDKVRFSPIGDTVCARSVPRMGPGRVGPFRSGRRARGELLRRSSRGPGESCQARI